VQLRGSRPLLPSPKRRAVNPVSGFVTTGVFIRHIQQPPRALTISIYPGGELMEIDEALEIVWKLANGLHIENGASLDTGSPFQHPQAVRALNRAVAALEFQHERERARHSLPANAGKPWSTPEDIQICDELRRGINFQEIARGHGRTVGSIVARLIRLGKISADAQTRRSA
jgi:hypothetical protein